MNGEEERQATGGQREAPIVQMNGPRQREDIPSLSLFRHAGTLFHRSSMNPFRPIQRHTAASDDA